MDRRDKKTIQHLLLLGLLITSIVGCSAKPGFHSIFNQGPLLLSTSNPYLGTNLYLAQEAEKSVFLQQFLNHRGSPSAMEIVRDAWGTPQMVLYYPQIQEVYTAHLTQNTDELNPMYEWIVQGPFPMRRSLFRELRDMQQKMKQTEPVLLVHGRPTRYLAKSGMKVEEAILSPSIEVTKNVIIKRAAPSKVKKEEKKAGQASGETKATASVGGPPSGESTPEPAIPTGDSFRPLNSDEQAIAVSKGFARRASNGDVVHVVVKETEDLSAIVTWYTGSATELDQVARRNDLPPDAPVPAGKEVVIPLQYVKQFKAYRP